MVWCLLFSEIPNSPGPLPPETQSTSPNSPETKRDQVKPRKAVPTTQTIHQLTNQDFSGFLTMWTQENIFEMHLGSFSPVIFKIALEMSSKTPSPTPTDSASAPSQTPPRPPWNCDHDEQYQRRHCLRDVASLRPADWNQWGVPQNGWFFFMENPSKNGWIWEKTHHFLETPNSTCTTLFPNYCQNWVVLGFI